MTAGAYPLLGVADLPNVDIASPGEVWTNAKANGNIVPGACVHPVAVGGKLYYKQVVAADTILDTRQVCIAMREVEIPDVNNGPTALSPNQVVNQLIASGNWVRRMASGGVLLTLVEPRLDYVPGQVIGWDPAAARPVGKASGTGAWTNVTANFKAGSNILSLVEYREVNSTTHEGIALCTFLRANQ